MAVISATQLLAKVDAVQPLYELKEPTLFLLNSLPNCKQVKLKYKASEVESACDDGNMNRYLSQCRSRRSYFLKFLAFGVLAEDTIHRGMDLTEVMRMQTMRFRSPFAEVWPKLTTLHSQLHVS